MSPIELFWTAKNILLNPFKLTSRLMHGGLCLFFSEAFFWWHPKMQYLYVLGQLVLSIKRNVIRIILMTIYHHNQDRTKMTGAVSVCDSPAGYRPDDLRNRPWLCGEMLLN